MNKRPVRNLARLIEPQDKPLPHAPIKDVTMLPKPDIIKSISDRAYAISYGIKIGSKNELKLASDTFSIIEKLMQHIDYFQSIIEVPGAEVGGWGLEEALVTLGRCCRALDHKIFSYLLATDPNHWYSNRQAEQPIADNATAFESLIAKAGALSTSLDAVQDKLSHPELG